MKKEESLGTEVVKIRLGSDDKARLQELAEREFRSFADQCRMALREWLETKAKKPAR